MGNLLLAIAISTSTVSYAAPAPAAKAGSWNLDLSKGSGSVEFRATGHPSALKIVGKGSAPRGSFAVKGQEVTGSAIFDLSSLDTGMELRTRHMKERYLETDKFKEARLTLTKMSLPEPATGDFAYDNVPFTGTLNLHGVEKPVSGTAKVARKSGQVSVAADFGLKISDYGIAVPKFAGITIADDVAITVADTAPVAN